jgi:RNA polymerase sigma-70 factor (ECF subfamily)
MNQIPAMLESEEEPTDDAGRRALLRRGLQLIKDDFSDSTWQAFWQQALQGREAGDVARELGLTPAAVRQARYRVLCRLREELAGL